MSEQIIENRTEGNFIWTNWAQNVSSIVGEFHAPTTEEEVVAIVQRARSRGKKIRVIGAGHSTSPLCYTTDILLSLDNMQGMKSFDANTRVARIYGGTRLKNLGEPMWEAGLSMQNQGDIDQQSLAGVMMTATKGSGINFGSVADRVRMVRLVDGHGNVVEIDESNLAHLQAARVSLGLLGIVTEIEYEAVPRYWLEEKYQAVNYSYMKANLDSLLSAHRHFSFFYFPTDRSSELYELAPFPGGTTVIKTLDEVASDSEEIQNVGETRIGPAYKIYPDSTTDNIFQELEYVVAAKDGVKAFEAVRDLMKNHPEQHSPIQVRWQNSENNYLAPNFERESVSISVSGIAPAEYEAFLRDFADVLDQFDARPHWGKINFLTAQRAEQLYPKLKEFKELRRQFDPDNIFLNEFLAEIFE